MYARNNTFYERTYTNEPYEDLINDEQSHSLYLALISFLFSYSYESRTTLLDPTPESAWTLCSLTPLFSALDLTPYTNPDGKNKKPTTDLFEFSKEEIVATLIPSYRRSLAFPLYRSFNLSEACSEDVASFLRSGKRTIFRCLLSMKNILDHHDVYYIYSRIWLDDFCVWIQAHAECVCPVFF